MSDTIDQSMVPVVGGPRDGAVHPFAPGGRLRFRNWPCTAYHWYILECRAWPDVTRESGYQVEYRWRYAGVGTLREPPCQEGL